MSERTVPVKLQTGMVGHRKGQGDIVYEFTGKPGDTVQMLASEAQTYIDRGWAVPISTDKGNQK